MATTRKRRKRKTGLGETDQPIVFLQNQNRRSWAPDLLKTKSDDSVLKTVLTWGAAIGIAYYGSGFLLGSIKKKQAASTLEQEEQKAATTTNTAAALAGRLKLAISDYGNTDEDVVWDIFEGKKIQSKEYFNAVAASYKILTKGRVLIDDLYNNLDPWTEPWRPDWNRLKPTLDKIMRTSNKSFVKAKPATAKKK